MARTAKPKEELTESQQEKDTTIKIAPDLKDELGKLKTDPDEPYAGMNEEEQMSKYFVEPIVPKPAPTFDERVESAIRDIEKRLDALEKEHRENPHIFPKDKVKIWNHLAGTSEE